MARMGVNTETSTTRTMREGWMITETARAIVALGFPVSIVRKKREAESNLPSGYADEQ
jgi:hypothetical protein